MQNVQASFIKQSNVSSNTGAVTIASAVETERTYKKEDSFTFSDIGLSATRSSVSLNVAQEGKESENITNSTSQIASNLISQNDININSNQDTSILASNLIAENNIRVNSTNGDINILSQEDLETIQNSTSRITNTTSLTVQNQWVETAYSAVDTAKSLKASVESDNADSKEGYINTLVTGAQAAKSATSAATLGFSVGASMTVEKEKTHLNSSNTEQVSSLLLARNGDVDLSGADINITASNIISEEGDLNLTAANDVNIVSAENNFSQTAGSS